MIRRARIAAWPLWAIVAVVALLGIASAAALRESAVLEKWELAGYDHLLAKRPDHGPREQPLTLVVETEDDLQRLGYPLSDALLADLLERLLLARPLAIVVDKYRDLPVGPGTERLSALLRATDRVFWVRKAGEGNAMPVRAPKELAGTPLAACGDVVADADGQVRRQLVYLEDAGKACYSLAFSAARRVLEGKGVKVAFDGNGALVLGERRLRPIDHGDGPYVTADTAGFQLPIEFSRTAPGAVSLSRVLEGSIDPSAFRDRVVFFGSSAESLRDFFSVPRAGRPGTISGVELHAQATATLLDAAQSPVPPLRLSPPAVTWTMIAVSGALAAACVLMVRHWMAAGALIVVAAMAAYAVGRIAIAQGCFVSFIPALAAVAATGFLAFAARAWREQAQRSELLGLFSRQVSEEVAAAMWEQRAAFYREGIVPTRELAATVLFLDIRGFTTTTERLGTAMVSWLNRGLSAMTDVIMENHGVVTRFVGDQIMAVYGVPVPRTDEADIRRDARRAVETALRIGERLAALNRGLEAEGLPAIRVRIGLNSGRVTQGAVGSSLRFEFTVLGDTVNTAARLESYSSDDDGAPARVLIGESTYRLCGEHFRCEPMGALLFKGKEVTVNAYRVFGMMEGNAQ